MVSLKKSQKKKQSFLKKNQTKIPFTIHTQKVNKNVIYILIITVSKRILL